MLRPSRTIAAWPHLLARTNRALVHHPSIRWVAAVALALAAALGVRQRLHGAEQIRRAWGESRHVLVATAAIPAGTPLRPELLTERIVPVAAVPADALTGLTEGLLARDELGAGEILVAHHTTIGSGLPSGFSGVALPAPGTWKPTLGDPVEVIEVADPIAAPVDPAAGAGPAVLTRDAVVISTGPDGVVLAVPDPEAAAVAVAGAAGRAVLVLLRAPGAG